MPLSQVIYFEEQAAGIGKRSVSWALLLSLAPEFSH